MNNKNQHDITNTELAKLIESVAVNLVSLQEKVTTFQKNVEQRFEDVEERFDKIDGRLDRAEESVITKTYLDIRLEKIESGAFTPDEKKSLFDTVKLVNARLADNMVGRTDITLTRPEYDTLMESVRLPNRFLKPEIIEVE